MSGYRIPVDAHAILYRPCPWCSEWTPVGRETCIECEEEITTEQVSCRGCRGTGTYDGIDQGAEYRPGDPPVYRERRCDLCGGSGVLTPDPPPDTALLEWMTAPPGDDDSRHIHELMIEPEAESSPWLWELRPVNGSSWVRGLSLWDGRMWIVTEDRGRARAWSATSTALMVAAVEQRLEEGAIGSAVSSILHDRHNRPAPVPMKVTEQDLQAALKASLKGGG